MSRPAPICKSSTVAVSFWHEQLTKLTDFRSDAESFFVLTLDGERRLTGAHRVLSRAFGNAQRFADELLAFPFLRGPGEFLIVHSRPGAAPKFTALDIDRVSAVITAGRARKVELLDYLIMGTPNEAHPSGYFSSRRLPPTVRRKLFPNKSHE